MWSPSAERYVPERQYYDGELDRWFAERAYMRRVRAQPIVAEYRFKAYVFCNAELRTILERRERVRRVPAAYLLHLPATPLPLDGEPIATADW